MLIDSISGGRDGPGLNGIGRDGTRRDYYGESKSTNPLKQGEVFSWGIGEIGELARDVCPMKFPAVPGSDDEPAYDFEGIRRDHITPGGMYRATGQDGLVGARMEGVKVRVAVLGIKGGRGDWERGWAGVAGVWGAWGGVWGAYSFAACLSRLTIDHASVSRRSTGLIPNRDTSNVWALITLFSIYYMNTVCLSYPRPGFPSVTIYLLG